MPGLSRFSRKQPSQEATAAVTATAVGMNGTSLEAGAAPNGKGSGAPSSTAVVPPNAVSNAESSFIDDGSTDAANFSTSLQERPSTSGSNAFADIGNMFSMNDDDRTTTTTSMAKSNVLDSTFLSSNPTEGGMAEDGEIYNVGDSFMQGFGSRPSTGEGGDAAFQFGNMSGFEPEGVDTAEQTTTANDGAMRAPNATKVGRAGFGGGGGIGFFAKRRTNQTDGSAPPAATSNPPQVTNTNSSSLNNDSMNSICAGSFDANLSHFDTNLLSGHKSENEAPSSSSHVRIPKSIATIGGDVEDDLTVATNTSVVAAARDSVVKTAPDPAAKSPYFSSNAVNKFGTDTYTSPIPSPDREEIVIPGMEKGDKNTDLNLETKQGPSPSSSQRVSLSPPVMNKNQGATKVDQRSIEIPVVNNENTATDQTMVQLGEGAAKGKTHTAVCTADTQLADGKFTSSETTSKTTSFQQSALGNSVGIGRFNSTEKVRFVLPESTSKTSATINNAIIANTTAITPDHRNTAKQSNTSHPSDDNRKKQNQQNAVTPTPHKTIQYERVVPGMPTNDSDEIMADFELENYNDQMDVSIRSPTPTTNANTDTPKASNIGGYSGSSMLATHESFDELLSQLSSDLTEATDIHNKGIVDLLDLEVTISHVYAKLLHFKGQYIDILGEIDAVASMGDSLMVEFDG